MCGVRRDQIESAARLLWESRPVTYYAWSGVEQQTGSTQIARAIGQLDALTGSLDAPGGNVLFPAIPTANVAGHELMSAEQRARTLGLPERPLGPSRWGHVSSEEVYRAILEHKPYAVRGIVEFGANLLLSHADGQRGRRALAALDFYVHADLFMNPTLEPRIVCGQHGWWQTCPEIRAPGYDPFGPDGANVNHLIGSSAIDPISGSVPHRAYLCQISRVD
jgi:anaerobic selenocysteine-containing dehydrogenase